MYFRYIARWTMSVKGVLTFCFILCVFLHLVGKACGHSDLYQENEKLVDLEDNRERRGLSQSRITMSRKKEGPLFRVNVTNPTEQYSTGQNYLSVVVAVDIFRQLEGGRNSFNVTSTRLQHLAKGLAPCSVRMAANRANFLIFNPDGRPDPISQENIDTWKKMWSVDDFWKSRVGKKEWTNFNVTGDQMSTVLNFFQRVGWETMLNLNQLLKLDNSWDPSNFKLLLDYLMRNDLHIHAFQLSLEPNAYPGKYGFELPPEPDAVDHKILKSILTSSEYRKYFQDCQVVGPEVNSIARKETAREYLRRFLEAGGGEAIDAVGLHHYYINGHESTVKDFLRPVRYDAMRTLVSEARSIMADKIPNKPVYITETAGAWGGGAKNISNRYAATFIFLDQLGLAATLGVARIYKMSFLKGTYALIANKANNYEPRPNYFVALLYKRLVLGPVFQVSLNKANPLIRVYAQCARIHMYGYKKGDIVIFYVNLRKRVLTLRLQTFHFKELDLFQLTGPPGNGNVDLTDEQLQSPFIYLNGQKLEMAGDDLPMIVPRAHRGLVIVPALSSGFVVVKNAKSKACRKWRK